MKRDLVNEKQPFGHVENHTTARFDNGPKSGKNSLAATTERFNSGVDQTQSFANKAPNAHEMACKGRENPFGPVGMGFESKATFNGQWQSPL